MTNKKKYGILFLINLIVCWIAYGIYTIAVHFSTDDYYALFSQRDTAYDVIGMSYRNVLGVVYIILDKLGINVVAAQQFFCIFFIIVTAVAITLTSYIVYTELKNKNIIAFISVDIGAIMIFVNIFTSEWMWYSLAYIQWSIAIIGCVLALYFLSRKERLLCNTLYACMTLFIAAGCYQAILAQFAFCIMCIIFIQNDWKITRSAIFSGMRSVLAAGFGVGANIISTKILGFVGLMEQEPRTSRSGKGLLQLLLDYMDSQRYIWRDSIGMLPDFVMLIVGCILIIVTIIIFVRKRCHLDTWLFMLLILISGHCVIFMSQYMQGSVWMPARMSVPVFCMFTVLIWIIADSDMIKSKYIVAAVNIIFVAVNIFFIQTEAVDTYKTNELDRQYANMISNRIQKYEAKNNICVSKIGLCMDRYPLKKYYDIIHDSYSGEMQLKAFYTEWSGIYALDYYMERDFEEVDVPSEYARLFSENNWNQIDLDEQLIFDGDTVYICLY